MTMFGGIMAKDGKFYAWFARNGDERTVGPFDGYEEAVACRDKRVSLKNRLEDHYTCWSFRFPRHDWALNKLDDGAQSVLRAQLHTELTMTYLWEKANDLENPGSSSFYEVLWKVKIGGKQIDVGEKIRFNGTAIECHHEFLTADPETIRSLLLSHHLKRLPKETGMDM